MAAETDIVRKWWLEFWVKVTVGIVVAFLGFVGTWAWGKHQGTVTGYEAGYEEGKQLGQRIGQDKGYVKGLNEGKDRDKWHEEGKKEGEAAGYAHGHTDGLDEGEEKGKKSGYAAGHEEGLRIGSKYGIPSFLDNYERHLKDIANALSIYKDNKDAKQLINSVNGFLEGMKAWRRVIEKLEAFKNGALTELEMEMRQEEPDYAKIERIIETLRKSFQDRRDATYEELKSTELK